MAGGISGIFPGTVFRDSESVICKQQWESPVLLFGSVAGTIRGVGIAIPRAPWGL
jgi:hypothetical protein